MARRVAFAPFVLAGLAVLAAAPARALLVDLDQIAVPRHTEPGAASVHICTYATGETPGTPCTLLADFGPYGYDSAQQPLGDFFVTPSIATSLIDLWSDGHRVNLVPAQLLVTGLAAGVYEVTLFSYNPAGTDFDSTVFEVQGQGPYTIENNRLPNDLVAEQTLTLPVVVGAEGTIAIRYWSGNRLSFGHLNGVAIVPEPGTLWLLAAGLLLVRTAGRRL